MEIDFVGERSQMPEVLVGYDVERAHGYYEQIALSSDQFVKMGQVRGEKNKVADELKANILQTGLLNPIDVARLAKPMMEEYVQFVNKVWKSPVSIDDLADYCQVDANYYLIVAGHSRHQAISELEAEGTLAPRPILAKVHPIDSIDDILAIQIGENVHSQPPKERRAMAIVESYFWGLSIGRWNNQGEFLDSRADSDVSQTYLSEALHFTSLPSNFRDFVLNGHMAYSVGVELGKTVPVLLKSYEHNAGVCRDQTEVGQPQLEALVTGRLSEYRNYIVRQGLNSSAATKYLEGQRGAMIRQMSQAKPQTELELELFSPEVILDGMIKEQEKRLKRFRTETTQYPIERAEALVASDTSLVNAEERISLDEAFRMSAVRAHQRLNIGSWATDSAGRSEIKESLESGLF